HEEGTFSLSGVATYQVLTPSGWTSPTINHASMTNSMNNFSGNGGANVSSGVGNQQSNSLSIAAGCRACM
ncbi:heme utilization protein, partial [Pseudomonas fragi]|nr:heme utilization protein [Pseudomonas sp. GC01]